MPFYLKNMFKKLMLKKFEKSRLPGNSREFEPSKILENSRLENSRCIPLGMNLFTCSRTRRNDWWIKSSNIQSPIFNVLYLVVTVELWLIIEFVVWWCLLQSSNLWWTQNGHFHRKSYDGSHSEKCHFMHISVCVHHNATPSRVASNLYNL
jgi:hypothetical protein